MIYFLFCLICIILFLVPLSSVPLTIDELTPILLLKKHSSCQRVVFLCIVYIFVYNRRWYDNSSIDLVVFHIFVASQKFKFQFSLSGHRSMIYFPIAIIRFTEENRPISHWFIYILESIEFEWPYCLCLCMYLVLSLLSFAFCVYKTFWRMKYWFILIYLHWFFFSLLFFFILFIVIIFIIIYSYFECDFYNNLYGPKLFT